MQQMGQSVMILGLVMVIVGVALSFGGNIPFLGKLPGDIYIDRGNFKFYFPITTSILISILLTIIISIFKK